MVGYRPNSRQGNVAESETVEKNEIKVKNMKKWLKMMALSCVAMAFCGCCSSEENEMPLYLEVTPNNIAGSWQLLSFQDGLTLAEGSYVYIDFERSDKSYKLYQNTDSFSARCITGRYNLQTDSELGTIIRGNYDYENGDWNHRYVIRNLTKTQMVWVAVDDPSEVSVYVRASIPEEILASAPAEE